MFSNFVKALLNHKNILVAGVNGHAVGAFATTLALYDFVYAAEGKAKDLLLFGKFGH